MSKHDKTDQDWTLPNAIEQLAEQTDFTSTTPLAQAGRIAMARHVRKLYAHLPGALSGDDPHGVHQARVATRRLRASLQATSAAFDADQVRDLNKQLRRLARALGEVRDRDVLLMRLRKDVEPLDDAAELHAVIERLTEERAAAHAALVQELQRKRTTRLLHDLEAFLTATPDGSDNDDDALPLLVRHHAGSAIWREYGAVQRFESVIDTASAEQLHNLRIACKHLRYTLELFEPALGEDAAALIKQVTKLQEQLGDIHDADVALEYLDAVAGADQVDEQATDETVASVPLIGMAHYRATRIAERDASRRDATNVWRSFTTVTSRRKLGRVLADM